MIGTILIAILSLQVTAVKCSICTNLYWKASGNRRTTSDPTDPNYYICQGQASGEIIPAKLLGGTMPFLVMLQLMYSRPSNQLRNTTGKANITAATSQYCPSTVHL